MWDSLIDSRSAHYRFAADITIELKFSLGIGNRSTLLPVADQ
jgi:hypothetical protein